MSLDTKRNHQVAYVLVFEGLGIALASTADIAGISAAWDDTPWQPTPGGAFGTTATWYPCLFYPEEIKQEIELWNPSVKAGSLRVSVADPTDAIAAIAFGNASSANRTYLTEDLAPDDTTITVKETGGWPSSGEHLIYIGHEAILVDGANKTSTGWTLAERAQWALFETEDGTPFAPPHRINRQTDAQPIVTSSPRTGFHNRSCQVWMHVKKDDGSWSTKAEAECIWTGRCKGVRDTGKRKLEFETVLISDRLDTRFLEDQFTGRIAEGRYLAASQTFCYVQEWVYGDLDNKVELSLNLSAGMLTAQDVIDALKNALVESESGLRFAWTVGKSDDGNVEISVKLGVGTAITSAIVDLFRFRIGLDRAVWDLLGYPKTVGGSYNYETGGSDGRNTVNVREVPFAQIVSGTDDVGSWMLVADNRPIKYDFAHFRNLQRRIRLDEDTSGTWAPQPVTTRQFGGQEFGEGFLQIADMAIVFGYFDEKNGSEFIVLEDATTVFQNMGGPGASNSPWSAGAVVREGEVSSIEVRQVWWEKNLLRDILLRLMFSTGTAGYNSADYDQYPAGFGLAIPYSLIDVESFQQLAGVDGWNLLVNKPTAFLRILESGIAAHGRHLVYRDGQLALVEPKLDGPTIAVAWELDEDNKASPDDRASYEQGSDGIVNRCELKYDRDLGGNFKSSLILEDIVSSTDYEQKRAISIEAWGLQTGDDGRQGVIDRLFSKVLAFGSRPMTIVERTVDKTMHGRIAPGDTVLYADDYVMNPRTGTRGLTAQPAWILGTILSPSKFRTRVRLAYSADMAVDKICAWAPSVRLDHAATDEGYVVVSGSSRYLACLPYQYDGQNEGVGVERFEVGDLLIVRELSPPADRDPYVFHVEVESIDDDPADPRIYLADPIVGWSVGSTVKKYIVTPDVIGTVQQAQKRDTFIADDATDTTGASANDSYEWGATRALGTSAAPTLTQQPIRLPFPLTSYLTGQGYPLAVGDYYELLLSLNNLYAYGTRHHAGSGAWTHAAAVTSGTSRQLIYGPVWVPLTDPGARDLLVKLRAKSSDGSSLRFIITTSRSLPVGTSATTVEFRDDTESLGEAEVTTTSTSFTWLTETPVACYPEPGALGVWLTIEADPTSGTGTLEGVSIQEDEPTSGIPGIWILEGAKPSDDGFLNRCTASGPAMTRVIGYMNQLLQRRTKVHAAWWTWASNPTDPDSSFRARIFCSSRCDKLRVRVLIEAVRFSASAQPVPSIKLHLKSLDAAATSEEQVIADETDGHVHAFRDTNIGPLTYRWVEFEIDLGDWFSQTGGTYEVRLEQIDLLQIRSMTIAERQRIIIPQADTVRLATPIYDSTLDAVWSDYRDLLHDQRQVLFTWSTQDSGQARSIPAATASLVNIFDTSQVGYAAAAAGFWCWPENCATFESNDVDLVVWAMVDFDNTIDAAERYVSFATATGTIATIELPAYNGASGVASIALQAKWGSAGALSAAAKIDVLAKNTDASGMLVYAAGAYLKIPLDPRTIDDLAVWLAADRITGLSDGASVSSWADSSGNANHATQGTAANRPTYETNEWNGKPVVRFDGTNDHLTIADSSTFKGTKLTVFVVSKSAAGAAGVDTLIGYPHTSASTDWRWAMQVNVTTNKFSLAYPGVGAGDEVSAADACNNVWRVWAFESFDFVARRDGIGKIEFDLDAALSYPNAVGLFLGANGNGAECWQGDIAEVLVYNRELTAAERYKVELYLAEKYGLVRGQNWDS